MRIIEPHTLQAVRKSKQSPSRRVLLALVGFFILVIIATVALGRRASTPPTAGDIDDKAARSNGVAGTQASATPLKRFSGEQFQEMYEALALPNTELITVAPTITGDTAADAHIQRLAVRRGYKLRSVPVLPIVKTTEPHLDEDNLLQPKAYEAWQALARQAKRERVPLVLNSGYRSIEGQRHYFQQQLQARGVTPALIRAGQADAALVAIMSVVAPPGYSRHHTGYAIDLLCQDGSGGAFEHTSCFRWLSQDNYAKAKQFGWVPSYPEGIDKQGPEPEAWEYVWVGIEATHEPYINSTEGT